MQRKQQYNVKRNLFQGKTFTIKEDSFELNEDGGLARAASSIGEFESREALVEYMERNIIENGGKIIRQNASTGRQVASNFVIVEDGDDPDIWTKVSAGNVVDKMNRKIVHYRFIEHCLSRALFVEDYETKMHLLPLPQRVPIPSFA